MPSSIFSGINGSYTFLEMKLPSQSDNGYSIRLYYNRLAPRHREERKHSHLAIELDMFGQNCHGTYVIGSKSYEINSGDIFILRSNEQHSIIDMNGGDGCICTGIQFPPDFVWSPSSELGNLSSIYDITISDRYDFNHRLCADNPATEKIRAELNDIVSEFKDRKADYSLIVKMKLIAILVMIARIHGETGGMHEITIQREKRRMVEKAMAYIEDHYKEQITFEEIAQNSNMSASYLSQLFKTLNGFSVWDYIISKRISFAKKRLSSSNDLILEISLQSGFNSLTNFNRTFKRLTGTSPKEYRKKNSAEPAA